jgi:preprotein translocase subunit SecE
VTKKKVRKIKSAAGQAPGEMAAKASGGASGSKSVAASVAAESAPGKLAQLKQFIKEVRAEFDKITWPSRKDTQALTIAVLSITLFFSFYLGLVDILLSKLVGLLMQ